MKTKITLFIAVLSLMFSVSTALAQTNLLTNGDFETGDFSDWRTLDVVAGIGLADMTDGASGSFSTAIIVADDVDAGNWAAEITWGVDATLQDWVFDQVPVTIAGNTIYEYKVWGYATDAIIMRLHATFFDASDAIVLDHADESWVLSDFYEEHTFVLPETPAGATYVDIGFRAWNVNAGAEGRWPATEITTVIDDARLFLVSSTASVEDQALDQAISFYPNPATDLISVDSRISLDKVEIFSMLGQRVKEVNSDFNSISISNLSGGNIYIVKIYSEEGGVAVRKLIKQ